MSKAIGIKLADGSFYPILEEGKQGKKTLDLTTVKDNQTLVHVDLYRSETNTMDDAEYVDTLQINNLIAHPNGEPDISLDVILDDENSLSAEIRDPESGGHSMTSVHLVNRSETERNNPANFELTENEAPDKKADTDDRPPEERSSGTGLLAAAGKLSSGTDSGVSIPTEKITIDEIPEEFGSMPESEKESVAVEPDSSFFDLPDFGTTDQEQTEPAETDFSIPEFDDTPHRTPTTDSPMPSSGLDFSDLYDKETAAGTAAAQDYAPDSAKKTKKHVIICLICALICIAATVLILFIVPSPVNLLPARNTKNSTIEQPSRPPVNQLPAEPVQPPAAKPAPKPLQSAPETAPAAKENKIVVAPAATTIPEVPRKKKSSNISYKIRWGDTLWDISETYYRNPWEYKKIARFNHIKNPDYIISGTTIIIPAQ